MFHFSFYFGQLIRQPAHLQHELPQLPPLLPHAASHVLRYQDPRPEAVTIEVTTKDELPVQQVSFAKDGIPIIGMFKAEDKRGPSANFTPFNQYFRSTLASTHLVGFNRLMLTRTISLPMPSRVLIRSDISLTRLSRHSACWTGRPWTRMLAPRSRVSSSTSAPISPTWEDKCLCSPKMQPPCPPSSECLIGTLGSQ